MNGTQTLDVGYKEMKDELPRRIARFLAWLRSKQARLVCIPVGLALTTCAMFWFLPVVGIELLPIGLLLAQDVPGLREPVGRFILFAVTQWRSAKSWSHARGR